MVAERIWGIEELKDAVYELSAKSAPGVPFGGKVYIAMWNSSHMYVVI